MEDGFSSSYHPQEPLFNFLTNVSDLSPSRSEKRKANDEVLEGEREKKRQNVHLDLVVFSPSLHVPNFTSECSSPTEAPETPVLNENAVQPTTATKVKAMTNQKKPKEPKKPPTPQQRQRALEKVRKWMESDPEVMMRLLLYQDEDIGVSWEDFTAILTIEEVHFIYLVSKAKGQPLLPKDLDLRKGKYWTVSRILKKAGPRKHDTLESCTRQYAFVLIDIYKILSHVDDIDIKTMIGHAISTIFDLRCDLYSREKRYTSTTWYAKMKTFLDNLDDKKISITKYAFQTDGMSFIHNRLDRFNDLLITLSKVEKALLSYNASNETSTSTGSTTSTTDPITTPTLSHPYFLRHFLAELKSNNDGNKEEKDITKKTTIHSISRKATKHGRRRG